MEQLFSVDEGYAVRKALNRVLVASAPFANTENAKSKRKKKTNPAFP